MTIDRSRLATFGAMSTAWQTAATQCARDVARLDPQGTAPTLWQLVDWAHAFGQSLADQERRMSGASNQ